MNTILEVKNISKGYLNTFKVSDLLKKFINPKYNLNYFWALKNINFSLKKGESLGIIGDNGAGKSTLLQIIAGVLPPTEGVIIKKGRTLAILELGIGFHPELTGIENIFAYGQLLSIPDQEIKTKISSIIEFSELGDFINRPLKTFSTGMVLRLAFAVATMLNPEILIIDEALAVGDISFQEKCIKKIKHFLENQGTLIFCSHALYQVSQLCQKVIWLKDGTIYKQGNPQEIIPLYEKYALKQKEGFNSMPKITPVKITGFEIKTEKRGKKYNIIVTITTKASKDQEYHISVSLKLPSGQGLVVNSTKWDNISPLRGSRSILYLLKEIPLIGGYYLIHIRILDKEMLMVYDQQIKEINIKKESNIELGCFHFKHQWYI